MRYALTLLLTIFVLSSGPAAADAEIDNALAMSRAAIGVQIPELSFKDTEGKSVNLGDYRGKPLIVSLIYTACSDVCPAVIDNLYPAIESAQSALGQDSFSVITIGFDTRQDTPGRMRSFARTRGVDLPNWHFLSGEQAAVDKLAKAVGFTIVPSAGGFDHMAQVSLVDSKGSVYQQIYGGTFSAPALVEPLKDLVYDRQRPLMSVEGIIERVKLYCTVYNPNTGRYYFNYSLFIGIAIGLGCLLMILGWLIREFRRSDESGTGHA